MPIVRDRLTAILSGHGTESVSFVIAPAGFGKTTLLNEYLSTDASARLVALRATTAGAEAFLREVLAVVAPKALRSLGTMFGQSAMPGFSTLLGNWFDARLQAFEGTIAIDDLHHVGNDPLVMAVLSQAVASSIGRIRWLLTSRTAPQLPFGTWIARGWMALPITDTELSFDPAEVGALAAELEVDLDARALHETVEETRGWPIGVRLALDLRRRNVQSAHVGMRTRSALHDIIDSEIWASLTSGIRGAAYACALLQRANPSLLMTAGVSSAPDLDGLVSAVSFVQREYDGALVMHDMFREFVIGKTRGTKRARTIERRLGEALSREQPAAAAKLYVASHAIDELLELLAVNAFDMIEVGERSTIEAALSYLARTPEHGHPVVLAIRGSLQQVDGSSENASSMFLAALDGGLPDAIRVDVAMQLALNYVSSGEAEKALSLLGPLTADEGLTVDRLVEMRSVCAQIFAAAGRVDDAKRTMMMLEGPIAHVSPAVRVHALQRLGFAAYYIGKPFEARRFSLDAAQLAEDLGMYVYAAKAYSTLYIVSMQNENTSDGALHYARMLLATGERAGHQAMHVMGARAVYGLLAEMSDIEGARDIDRLMQSLPDARSYRDGFSIRLSRALIAIAEGDLRSAFAAITAIDDASLTAPERIGRQAYAALILVLLGRREEALKELGRAPLLEVSADFVSKRWSALAFALRGAVLWACDHPAQARRAFDADFSHLPERNLHLVDALKKMVMLQRPIVHIEDVAEISSGLEARGLRAFATIIRLLTEGAVGASGLSEKEIEILQELFTTGGTTEQVAAHLKKSRHTVESQLKSAIRKLGCSGRAEAVAIAHRHGLVTTAHSVRGS